MSKATTTADSPTARAHFKFFAEAGCLRRQIDAAQQPVPRFKAERRLRSTPVDVDTVPDFRRRSAVKGLMWPHSVVPEPELGQRRIQHVPVRHAPAIEFLFQCAEKAFDPAVHPRGMQVDGLVPDAKQLQAEPEEPGRENPFVIGANDFWPAVTQAGLADGEQKRQRTFVRQGFESQIEPRAVIDDAENGILPAANDGLAGQINPPKCRFCDRACPGDGAPGYAHPQLCKHDV